jgi:hypothetical protein
VYGGKGLAVSACPGHDVYDTDTCNHIARLNANGTRDYTFKTIGGWTDNPVYAIKLQSDGKILAGGVFISYKGQSCKNMARIRE